MEERSPAALSLRSREPLVVVLTGGPCSGKSSALALLRDRLSTRGFQVLTVPENATHLLTNSDGFQPEWAGTESQAKMQRIFLDFQIAQEDAFRDFAALHPSKPAVLLLDCCTVTSRVYVSDEQWEKVLAPPDKPNLTEEALLNRYDLVIHMVTCAAAGPGGGYEYGPGSNNPGRYHTPEQARETDQRALEVFGQHPQLRVVPNCSKFEDKIGKVVEFVNDALHIEGLTGKRRRQACRVIRPEALEALLGDPSTSSSLVTCTFLNGEQMTSSVRKHARMPGTAWAASFGHDRGFCPESVVATNQDESVLPITDVLYEIRHKVFSDSDAVEDYLTRRVITKEDYNDSVKSVPNAPAVTKHILRFLLDSNYYELFVFEGQQFILDFSDESPCLPHWLELVAGRDEVHEESDASSNQSTSASVEDQHICADSPEVAVDFALTPKDTVNSTASKVSSQKPRRILRACTTEEAAWLGC